MKNKAMGTIIIALAIGGLLGFGGGYMYQQDAAEQAWEEGAAYQQSVTPQEQQYYADEVDLGFEWSPDSEYDHSGTVDVDGNVAADTAVTKELTIINDDDSSAEVWVLMYDPTDDDEGLDEELEYEETELYMNVGGIDKLALYEEEEYTDGVEIGTLPAGAETTVEITFEFLEHDDEDYKDGEEYDIVFYIWQPNANHVEEVEATVLT